MSYYHSNKLQKTSECLTIEGVTANLTYFSNARDQCVDFKKKKIVWNIAVFIINAVSMHIIICHHYNLDESIIN